MAVSVTYFYHYTNVAAAKSIVETKKILASSDNTNDAKLGIGVYVTKITPDHHTDAELLFNNFGKNGSHGKTEEDTRYYIKIPTSAFEKNCRIGYGPKGKRDRYLIEGSDLGLQNISFSVGKRQERRIIWEVCVDQKYTTATVLSWLNEDMKQASDCSCLVCHQSIDHNECAIRFNDKITGLHPRCLQHV